jgi:hypothetical protein
VALRGSGIREHWRGRMLSLESGAVEDLLAAAPGVTEIARRSTVELIMVNRGRLLDVLR